MGNAVSAPIQIGVRLDQPTFEAGDRVTGRVYLQIKGDATEYQAIHIRLEGKEHVEVSRQQQVTPSFTSETEHDDSLNEHTSSQNRERHYDRHQSSGRGSPGRQDPRGGRCERERIPSVNQRRQAHSHRIHSRNGSLNREASCRSAAQRSATRTTKSTRTRIRISEDERSSSAKCAQSKRTEDSKKTSSSPRSTNEAEPTSRRRGADPLKIAGAMAASARKAMDKESPSIEDTGSSTPHSRKANPLKVGAALAVNAKKAMKKGKRGRDEKREGPPPEFTLRSLPPPETITVSEHSCSILVQYDVLLTQLYDQREGQYEYPFEWPLPEHLPTSMYYDFGSGCNGEIKYTLTAYLVGGPERHYTKATTTFGVAARPSISPSPSSIQIQPTGTPIIGCCCTNHGVIYLGCEAAGHVCPRDTLQVHISGENQSEASIPYIRVVLYEMVEGKTDSGEKRNITKTLASSSCSVSQAASWQPHRRGRHSSTTNDTQHESLLSNEDTSASLVIPADACDTYRGRLITVRHVLEVTALTRGMLTSPSCSASIQVRRPSAHTVSQAPPVAVEIPVAQAVPMDWYAQSAQVVVLPSAPDESLLHEIS